MKTPKFTIVEFNKIDNVEEFTTDVIDISDVVSLNVDFMFSFALTPSENVEVEVLASQDGINFSNNAIGKFNILTYSLNTRYTRNFSFSAINYIKFKVKVPHVADIKLTGVKEKDISPNLEIKNNLLANNPPISTDDFSKGYVVGSIWVDNNEKVTYVCVDNTVGNSNWTLLKMPDHEINGSQVRFKNPDGSWGDWIVLGGTVLDIENSQIKLKDTADNVLSTININTDLINDTTNNRFVTDSDINRWNDTYTTSTIDSSLNTKVNKSGDVMTGELGLPSFKLGDSNVFYVGGSEIVTMRNWGTEPSTLFSIRALPPKSWKDGAGADFTNVDREATLALIRTDDIGNEEFLDLYNNGYNSSTNDDAVQYGIRIQKRGIGEYRDFVFDRSDGNLKEAIWKIKTDKTMEFYEPLSIQGGISDLSGRSLSKNDLTDTLLNKLNNIEDGATADQSASEILSLLKTVDGSGSGLNSDYLDGHDSSYFSIDGHNHDDSYYTKTQINSSLNLKEDKSNKGSASGYASLDANAKVPLNQLPDISKQATHVVLDISERDSLTGLIEGDKAFITSTGDSYIWNGSSWVLMADADWQNVNLDWSNIVNVPSPTISLTGDVSGSGIMTDLGSVSISASVDDNSHSHDNTTLNSIDWSKILNKPDPTITLSGDLTGSTTLTDLGNATLSASIKDDSHNHVISNVDGLQSALDGKSSTSHTHSDLHSHSNKSLLDTITNSGDGLKFLSNDGSYKNLSSNTYWGEIQGTLSSQTDLKNALNAKSNTSHNHDSSYLGISAKAADSDKLDGLDSSAFAPVSHSHGNRVLNTSFTNNSGSNTWIAFASTKAGDHAMAVLSIFGYNSGKHAAAKFIVSFHHGQGEITQIAGDSYSGNEFYHLRMMYNSSDRVYGGSRLELYMFDGSSVYATLESLDTGHNYDEWRFIPAVVTQSGWTAFKQLEHVYKRPLQTTGKIYTQGNEVWHSGNFDPSTKSDTGHNHNSLYYTETEIDTKLDGKSDTGHNHNSLYYTETEIDTKLDGKSDTGHTHSYLSLSGGTLTGDLHVGGGSNKARISIIQSNAGSPRIEISDTNGDNFWTLGADDGDNNFKINGSTSSMPNMAVNTPIFELGASNLAKIFGHDIQAVEVFLITNEGTSIRYKNGIQICFGTVDATFGGDSTRNTGIGGFTYYNYRTYSFDLPAEFLNTDYQMVLTHKTNTINGLASFNDRSAKTTSTFHGWVSYIERVSAGTYGEISYFAIGRWK